jgi:hypothetical protein
VPAAAAPPVDPATLAWIEARLERLRLDQAIDEARRRLAAATAAVLQLQGSLRPTGSAFPDAPSAVDALYVRGVADPHKPLDDALQSAHRERSDAARDLDRLLAQARTPAADRAEP